MADITVRKLNPDSKGGSGGRSSSSSSSTAELRSSNTISGSSEHGVEPRFNPGSNSGEAEYQHQEPGFKPGSIQIKPRFRPRFNPV